MTVNKVEIIKCDELSWRDFAIYFGDRTRSRRFIGFHLPLHNGWQSYPRWMKGGWEYYEHAILIGRTKTTGRSKWYKLPRILIPAKLVHLWRMRKKSCRQAMKSDSA